MRKTLSTAGMLSVTALAALAQPFESATVISATPVVTQVPHQVCTQSLMAVPEPKSGAGAIMGAIAGGVVGNAMGQGAGNAATTAIGVIGGAMLGDRVEGQNTQPRIVQQCAEQWMQVTTYHVEYELNGRRYTTQMAQDPGKTLMVQIAPAAPGTPTATLVSPPVYATPPVYSPAPPVYVAPPLGYPYPYGGYGFYPPIGIHFGIGYQYLRRH
jgi:uncharacterized protein YcfJ